MFEFQSDSEIDRFENGIHADETLKAKLLLAEAEPVASEASLQALFQAYGFQYFEISQGERTFVYAKTATCVEWQIGEKGELLCMPLSSIRDLPIVRELLLGQ